MEENFEKKITKYFEFLKGQKAAKKYWEVIDNELSNIKRKAKRRTGRTLHLRRRLRPLLQIYDRTKKRQNNFLHIRFNRS